MKMKKQNWFVGMILFFSVLVCCSKKTQDMPLSSSSTEAMNLYLQGRANLEKGKPLDALPFFEKALAKDSVFAFAYLGLADVYMDSREITKHFKVLQKAIALQNRVTENEKLYLQAIDAIIRVNNKETVAYLNRLVEQFPNDKRILLKIAKNYSDYQQLPDSALVYVKRSLAVDNDFVPAWHKMVSVSMDLENFPEAEKACLRIIELMPSEPRPLVTLADLYRTQRKFVEALSFYNKASRLKPNDYDADMGIAAIYLAREQYEQTRKQYDQMLARAGTDRERNRLWNRIADTYLDEGNIAKAVQVREQVLAGIEKSADHIYIANNTWPLAVIYLETNQWKKAKETHDKATRNYLASDFTSEIKKLAELSQFGFDIELAVRKGDLETAKNGIDQYCKKAQESTENNYIMYGHELKGMIYLYEKKYDETIDEFQRSDIKTNNVQFRLAQAFEGKGDHANAKIHYLNVVNAKDMDTHYFLLRKTAKMKAETL